MNKNPYRLDPVEMERHNQAMDAGHPAFGPEATVTFPHGFSIRTAAYPASAVYVRVCAPDGFEIAYFDEAEFARDPVQALSALIAHLDRNVDGAELSIDVLQEPGDNPYRLMPGEIIHRDATLDNSYGEEFILFNVSNGFRLTTPLEGGVDYVRICDPDGGETAYWTADEFAQDPSDVIGAMFGALVRGH